MKAIERRMRAIEERAALAAQHSAQAQQLAADAYARTLRDLNILGTRIVDAPTRTQNSPAECLSWLMHHTGEQGALAGAEALNEVVHVTKQPAHTQQDFYNAIEEAAQRKGIAWDGLVIRTNAGSVATGR